MKKLGSLVTMIVILCAGCSTLPENSAELQKTVIKWLEENKSLVKQSLVIAGIEIMNRAVSGDDRKAIANQMWALSTAYHSLASGEIVTQQKFDETVNSFTKGTGSSAVAKYSAQASILWASIFPKLKTAGAAKLATDYLVIFAEAAQQVAATYKEPDV